MVEQMSFGMDGPANKARVATSQDAVPPPVNQPDPVPQPRPVVQPHAAIKPGPVDDSQIDPRLSASRGRSHSRPGIPIDPRFPDADDRLKAAGYDLLTREGMIRALRENRSDPEHAVKHWVQHSKAPGMQARAKVYADAASEMRQGKDVDKVLKKYKLLESAARSEGSGLGGSSRGNGITTKALAAAVDSELKRQGKGEALRSQVSCELEAAKSGSIVKEILDRHRLPLELWDQYGKSVPQEGQGRPSRGKSKGGTPEQRGPRKDSRPVSQLHLNMLEKRIQEIGYLADDEEKACQEADAEMKAARSQDEVFNVIERYLGGKHSKAGMSLGIDWFARQHQRLERSGFHRLTVDEMLRDLALQPTPEDTKRLANSWRNAEAPQLDQGPAKAPTPSRAGSKQQEQRQGGHYAFPATEVDGFVDRMKKDGYPSETIEKAKRELLASDGPKAANEVSKKYLPARDGGIVLKPESLKGIKKALIQKGKELGWSEDVMMSTWGRINSIHNKRSIEVLKRFCKETLGLTLVV